MANKTFHPRPDDRFIQASSAASQSANLALAAQTRSAKSTKLQRIRAANETYRAACDEARRQYDIACAAIDSDINAAIAKAKADHATAREFRLEIAKRYRQTGDVETASAELVALT